MRKQRLSERNLSRRNLRRRGGAGGVSQGDVRHLIGRLVPAYVLDEVDTSNEEEFNTLKSELKTSRESWYVTGLTFVAIDPQMT